MVRSTILRKREPQLTELIYNLFYWQHGISLYYLASTTLIKHYWIYLGKVKDTIKHLNDKWKTSLFRILRNWIVSLHVSLKMFWLHKMFPNLLRRFSSWFAYKQSLDIPGLSSTGWTRAEEWFSDKGKERFENLSSACRQI